MHTKRISLVLILATLSTILAGCFLWSSIGDEWQDFTAYFNTYYNGKHAFDEAMLDVKSSMLEYNVSQISGATATNPFTISSNARQNFDIAIEKASKILQLYPNSGFTENCLFIIGISYYYEQDNIRGGRKFIEEQSKYPGSKRFCEALMYYGDIEVKNKNYADGYKDLKKALELARREDNQDIMTQDADDISNCLLTQSDSSGAAEYLDSAAAVAENDDAAIYACKAGELSESLGNFKNAEREYSAAWNYARDVRLRFYSRYFLARTERHDKQFSSAMDNLQYLRKDDKYFQFFPLIDYQTAEVWYDSGSVSSAFSDFQRIDTAYATSEAATRSAFRVANIYLYKVGDYQNAMKYYQKCSSHPAVAIISEKARQMSAYLQDYFVGAHKLQVADSLYRRAMHAASDSDSTIVHTPAQLDTLYEHLASAEHELAGFFLFRFQFADSALHHYSRIVSQFTKSRVYASALYTLGEYDFASGDTTNGKNYLTELIQEHPESGFALSANSLLGNKRATAVDSSEISYNQAIDCEDRGQHDSSLVILKKLQESSISSFSQQVLYAIGWIYENKLNLPDSSFVYYKKLTTKYPTCEYSANLNLALTTYEEARRDSAEAHKMVADSSTNLRRTTARDTVKEARAIPIRMGNAVIQDTSRERIHLQIQKADSIEIFRQRAKLDSAAMLKNEIEKMKKRQE